MSNNDEKTDQTTLDAFLGDVQEQDDDFRQTFGSGEFEDRSTLKAERDVLYEGYILEGHTANIESKQGYDPSTAVRLTRCEDGEKMTLWVSGFEAQHFEQYLGRWAKQDIGAVGTDSTTGALKIISPVKISFMRTQAVSNKTDRTYNKLVVRLDAHGEDVLFELESL